MLRKAAGRALQNQWPPETSSARDLLRNKDGQWPGICEGNDRRLEPEVKRQAARAAIGTQPNEAKLIRRLFRRWFQSVIEFRDLTRNPNAGCGHASYKTRGTP